MAGKRGRKTVYVEVDGKKGSKTFVGKATSVTLCNKCSSQVSCAILNSLKAITKIEAPVYGCASFIVKPEPVEVPKTTTEVKEK